MTDEELYEIESRMNMTQKGPWRACIENRDHECGSSFIMTGLVNDEDRGEDIEIYNATVSDYDFIANAKQDIFELVEGIKQRRNSDNIEKKVISEAYLNDIKKRYNSAQIGPWVMDMNANTNYKIIKTGEKVNGKPNILKLHGATEADFRFIAHLKQDVFNLVNEIADAW